MYGGFGGRTNLALVLGVVGLFAATPALSADLGGDCCADLEERVAELEATTARKGNRKVSLTVSGWVNEAIFAWDDGTAHGVYQGTNMIEQSRVRFVGAAKIDRDWSAGYVLEIGAQGNPSNQFSQNVDVSHNLNPANQDNALVIRKSNWFVKNERLGQISVGLNGTATYHLLDDADSTLTRNVDDAEGAAIYMSAFQLRHNGVQIGPSSVAFPLRWSDVMRGFNNSTPGDSGRREVVRYDSPTLAGFVVTAAWGQSDQWDAALTYKGEWNGISVLAKAGYGQSNDPGTQVGPSVSPSTAIPTSYVLGGTPCISSSTVTASLPDFECQWGGAAATIMHSPTGLFVFGGWGKQTIDTGNAIAKSQLVDPDSTVWFIQPGIEHKWLPLGKTNIFGEYRHDDAGSTPGSSAAGDKTVGASINFWQGGIIQNIEAADMSIYLVYQHADGYIVGNKTTTTNYAPVGRTDLDAFQEIIAGGKINF
jgi:hypothetical protein